MARHRGKQVSTLYTVWSTLFILSTAVKREAWLRFGENHLWSNFYCILVGPAGIAHKGEAINDAVSILEGFRDYIESPEFAVMKTINIVEDKVSPEALLEGIHPRNKRVLLPGMFRGASGCYLKDSKGNRLKNPATGRDAWYSLTSEAGIVAGEFATLAGQQRYNTGLIDNLLRLYDCDRPFIWRTVKRGRPVALKNLHTTLLAGTTMTGFRSSLSDAVRTDGFLSRSAIVYCPKTPFRRFSRPRIVDEAPSKKELQRRLAWITEHAVGEFDLTPEADKYYEKWYNKWWDDLEEDTQYQGLKSRIHVLVLKIAMLLRIQRYEVGPKLVDKDDIKDAIHLIQRTWFEALPVMKGFEAGDEKPYLGRMEEYLRERGEVTRQKLLRQGHFTTQEAKDGITMLVDEGKVEIHRGEKIYPYPSSDGKEIYRWTGEKWLGYQDVEAEQ